MALSLSLKPRQRQRSGARRRQAHQGAKPGSPASQSLAEDTGPCRRRLGRQMSNWQRSHQIRSVFFEFCRGRICSGLAFSKSPSVPARKTMARVETTPGWAGDESDLNRLRRRNRYRKLPSLSSGAGTTSLVRLQSSTHRTISTGADNRRPAQKPVRSARPPGLRARLATSTL